MGSIKAALNVQTGPEAPFTAKRITGALRPQQAQDRALPQAPRYHRHRSGQA